MNETATLVQRRIVVGAALCVVAFALVTVRLIDVTLFGDRSHKGVHQSFEYSRADLVDRNGELLARDLPTADVYARPHALWDREQSARDLAAATGAEAKHLAQLFAGDKPYVPVARHLTPDAQDRVMHLGLPGLDFQPSSKALLSRRARGRTGSRRHQTRWRWRRRFRARDGARLPPARRQARRRGAALHRHARPVHPGPRSRSQPRGIQRACRRRHRARCAHRRGAGARLAPELRSEPAHLFRRRHHARHHRARTSTSSARCSRSSPIRWRPRITPCGRTRSSGRAMAIRSAATRSTRPSTCRRRWSHAMRWRSPPTSSRPRSPCAPAPSASASSWTSSVCCRRSRRSFPETRRPLFPGPGHWGQIETATIGLRPRHFGQPARLCRRCRVHRQWRAAHRSDVSQAS